MVCSRILYDNRQIDGSTFDTLWQMEIHNMNLAKKAPRSPYNVGILGMMNLARMTDKALAQLNKSIGQYKFGLTSNRDCRTLSALGLTEKDFLDMVDSVLSSNSGGARVSNSSIANQLRFQTNIRLEQIKDFNSNERDKKPTDESYRQQFEFRQQLVGQPEIQTLPDMLDAEDAYEFGIPSSLTLVPPISAHSGAILGICCLGRLVSKAKGVLSGKLGDYKFGANSGLDVGTMNFININEAELLDGISRHTGWLDLISWLRDRVSRSQQEVVDWNQTRRSRGPWNAEVQHMFNARSQSVERTDLTTFLDLLDCEDAADFPQ